MSRFRRKIFKTSAAFVVAFLGFNAASVACLAYCNTAATTPSPVETASSLTHCERMKLNAERDQKSNGVSAAEDICCWVAVAMVAGPVEGSFSGVAAELSEPVALATAASLDRSTVFGPALQKIAARGSPPLDQRRLRVHHCVFLI